MSLLKKLPSLSNISEIAFETLKRFPLVILASAIGAVCSILGIYDKIKGDDLGRILMTLSLAITLLLSIKLFSERSKNKIIEVMLPIVGVAFLAIYYFTIPEKPHTLFLSNFFVLNIAFHLLVSFAGFIGVKQMNGFWHFNKTLFIRFLASAVYSGTIIIGLFIGFFAIQELLGFKIKAEFYSSVSVFVATLFNTWFFLAGVPEKLEILENETEYPKGIKVFTQFVLLPLLALYILILYSYETKIIINWELPQGYISYLVNVFSILGFLAFLLIWPIRNNSENKWIQFCSKWFYILLYPLIILQQISIWTRINAYGITEKRYYILILTFWLLGITLYFTFSKIKNIKLIPITLTVLGLLSLYGPQSASSVSLISQVNRLEDLLIKNNILVDGKIKKYTGTTITFEDEKSISSVLNYLDDVHNFEKINPWFNQNLDTYKDTADFKYGIIQHIAESYIGITYRDKYDYIPNKYSNKTFWEKNKKQVINTDGYNRYLEIDLREYNGFERNVHKSYYVRLDTATNYLSILKNDETIGSIDLSNAINKLKNRKGDREYYNRIDYLTENDFCKVFITSIHFKQELSKAYDLTSIDMIVLFNEN